jgi:DNA (cytosine-5)-methyltransferase 1
MGLDEVLSDLEGESYATRPFIVPACAVDAPHRRDRLWIICRNVGNTEDERHKQWSDVEREGAKDKQEQRLGVRGKPSGSSEDVAYAQSMHSDVSGEHTQQSEGQVSELGERRSKVNVSNTVSKRQQGLRSRRDAGNKKTHGKGKATQPINGSVGSFWEPEPGVGRVANGVSKRVDRLKGLGNAIVPQIAMRIGQTIKQIEEQDGR